MTVEFLVYLVLEFHDDRYYFRYICGSVVGEVTGVAAPVTLTLLPRVGAEE